MRRFLIILTANLLLVFAVLAPANARESIDDIFKDAIEKLLRKDENTEVRQRTVKVPAARAEVQLSFAPLVKKVAPSVVNVYAARKAVRQSPFAGDPFFERFFGGGGFGRPRQRNQSSLGSGVIVSDDGLVITNHHVIKDADEVKIALADGREYECEIMLKDEQSDLAVLKVTENVSLEPIDIGNSDRAEVGDLVLAIGNPFGVGQTVTSGIISAVARTRVGINDFGFFLQTDAAINPGNSGGALIDMQGRLIGINTAIFSRSGGSNGIGFAIPSNMVKVVLRSAGSADHVVRPWIGASFQPVTAEIAASLGMQRPRGALVAEVIQPSPANDAGLYPGDVILAVNGQRIEHVDALGYRLATVGIGNVAKFRVLSRGQRKNVSIELAPPPETVPRNETALPPKSVLGGSVVVNLSPAVTMELRIPAGKSGVVVTKVARRSYAAANRIRPGDIIREINGQPIERVRDLVDAVSQNGRRWIMVVERRGREIVFDRNGNIFRQYPRR